VIVFDTTFLVVLLQEKFPPVKDREDKIVPRARERVKYLVEKISADNSIICIPTPVLAEIMVRAGKAGPEYLNLLNDSSKFRLTAFDVRAAIEAGELIRKIKDEQKGQKLETWAKIKFDIQIVSIAKAEKAAVIYADDAKIESYGQRVGISVRRICDLELPPQEQEEDNYQPKLFVAPEQPEE
jgi:predicted nucleic acid-binding protein